MLLSHLCFLLFLLRGAMDGSGPGGKCEQSYGLEGHPVTFDGVARKRTAAGADVLGEGSATVLLRGSELGAITGMKRKSIIPNFSQYSAMLYMAVSSRTINMSEAVKKNRGSPCTAKGDCSKVKVAGVIFQWGKRSLDRKTRRCSGEPPSQSPPRIPLHWPFIPLRTS